MGRRDRDKRKAIIDAARLEQYRDTIVNEVALWIARELAKAILSKIGALIAGGVGAFAVRWWYG